LNNSKIIVSVCCLTYNHEKYIRQCLDGFVMQQTDFAYEILIHDDASTDSTADIIKEFEALYPRIIKPIYQKENQYSKGVSMSITYNFPRAKGKYIAMCEGDDFWTDSLKLQKQVDFLQENEDYVACGCYTDMERYGKLEIKDAPFIEKSFNQIDLIRKNPFPTLTTMFRKVDLTDYNNYNLIVGDIELFMYLSQFGDFMKLPFKGSVYRFHGKGVNSGNDHYANKTKSILAKLKFNEKFKLFPNSLYKSRLRFFIKSEIKRIVKNKILRRKGTKDSSDFIKFCIQQYKML